MRNIYLKALGAALFLGLILAEPSSAGAAARESMAVWGHAVAPALFPFMVVAPALTCEEMCALYRRLFGRLMRPLFGLPGEAAAAMVIAWLAGCPSGAMAMASIASHGGMTRGELTRGALLASGAGPSFFLSAVAAGMLGMPDVGWLLWRAQMGALILSGIVLSRIPFDKTAIEPLQPSHISATRPMTAAVNGILAVGGYMAVFAILARQLTLLFGSALELPILAALEMSGGCAAAAGSSLEMSFILPLIAAIACFGGASVFFQVMNYIKPLGASPKGYLFGKMLHAALAFGLTALQLHFWPLEIPAFAVQGAPRTDPMLLATAAASVLLLAGLGLRRLLGRSRLG